jgi:hypothetical protein
MPISATLQAAAVDWLLFVSRLLAGVGTMERFDMSPFSLARRVASSNGIEASIPSNAISSA